MNSISINPFSGKNEEPEEDRFTKEAKEFARQAGRRKAKEAILKFMKKSGITIYNPNSPKMKAFLESLDKKKPKKE